MKTGKWPLVIWIARGIISTSITHGEYCTVLVYRRRYLLYCTVPSIVEILGNTGDTEQY